MRNRIINIVIVIFSIIVGITITTASIKIPVDGVRLFWNVTKTCGNHLGGLPFAFAQQWQEPLPNIMALCSGANSFGNMIADYVIWSGAVYIVTRKIAKSILRQPMKV